MIQADNARLKQLIGTPLKLRMGVHAGEVTIVQDVNGQRDAAGDGIITAQRVMDLGDADHILLSSEVAKVLIDMDPWARYITHLGEVRVKHKIIVDIYNLYGRLDGPFCGNPGTPKKVVEDGRARSREAKALRPRLSDILRPHWGRIFALMFIGASPGGTGGGIKTTTLRVLTSCTNAILQGKEEVLLYNRKIAISLILKAVGVVFGSLATVIVATVLISITDPKLAFIQILFEVVSAFGTVGLSTGITGTVSIAAKLILILTMYIGRVGVLLLMSSILGDPRPTRIHYPEENLLVG
jgi:hypothetical protein